MSAHAKWLQGAASASALPPAALTRLSRLINKPEVMFGTGIVSGTRGAAARAHKEGGQRPQLRTWAAWNALTVARQGLQHFAHDVLLPRRDPRIVKEGAASYLHPSDRNSGSQLSELARDIRVVKAENVSAPWRPLREARLHVDHIRAETWLDDLLCVQLSSCPLPATASNYKVALCCMKRVIRKLPAVAYMGQFVSCSWLLH